MDILDFLNSTNGVEPYRPDEKIVVFIDINGYGKYDWVQIKNKSIFPNKTVALHCIRNVVARKLMLHYKHDGVIKSKEEISDEADKIMAEHDDRFKFETINVIGKNEQDIFYELTQMRKKLNGRYVL